TLLVAAVGHVLPESLAGTAIGFGFLLATYWLVLRSHQPGIERAYGLSLGGLLEPEPLSVRRLIGSTLRAAAWCLAAMLVFFPPFWVGYVSWYGTHQPFAPDIGLFEALDQLAAQLAVVALPEEAFFRGYLQTAL